MAKQTINIGAVANDNTGDPLRTAFDKANDNFTEIYDDKVDKVAGKGLSTNDYTTAEQSKLSGITTGATAYTDTLADARVVAGITNKVDKVSGSSLLADTKLALLDHEILGVACSDVTTDLTTGQKIAFDMPFSCVLTRVYGSLTTPATGNALTVDIEDEGSSILNAVLSIANGANNGEISVFAAAAASYAFTKGDLISIDIDQVGSTAAGKGLIIFLEGYRT